jgi:hypothetical protein
MIRQFIVSQEAGKPNLTGLLLLAGDLEEADVLKLGERLARLNEPAKGLVNGVRWKYVPTDHPTPGLEYITVQVPSVDPAYRVAVVCQDSASEILAALGPELAADFRLIERQCDRVPRWLWPLVAIVGLGIIIAGVR